MWIPDKFLIILDLETTDALLGIPEIIEIGAIKVDRELEIKDTFECFVRPSDLSCVSAQIQSLTGISPDDLAKAKSFDETWESFAEFTQFNLTRLCSWGTSFDIAVLREEYCRRNLGYPHSGASVDAATVVWTTAALLGLKIGGMSLQKACERFGVDRTQEHRALGDVMDVLHVFREIRNLTLRGLEDGYSDKFSPDEQAGEGSVSCAKSSARTSRR